MTVTERQAAFAADLAFGDLPAEVVDYGRRLLLDTAGIAVGAGSRAGSSEAFFEGIRTLDSGSGGPSSRRASRWPARRPRRPATGRSRPTAATGWPSSTTSSGSGARPG